MSTLSIAERVAAGVAWLDAHVPDWLERVDVARINTANCRRCVLGQLFGTYTNAPLWDRYYDAPPLGFQANNGAPSDERYYAEHADLTAEWVRVIEERRAQTAGAS